MFASGVVIFMKALIWVHTRCTWVYVFHISRLSPQFGHVGLCTGPRSLLTPQCGTYRALHNSFNGTNTVLRPGESREGEGRKQKLMAGFFGCCAAVVLSDLSLLTEATDMFNGSVVSQR